MTAFRLADMIEAFQFVLDTPKCYGKSPNGQQRTDTTGVPPQLSFWQSRPHCLRRFYHARTVTGREYHYPLCGLWRNRELPNILSRYWMAHHLSSLTVIWQVLAYRCTRLCSSQSQRESIWRMGIRFSKSNPVFATQRKTGWEFLSSHPVARGNIRFSPLLKKLF